MTQHPHILAEIDKARPYDPSNDAALVRFPDGLCLDIGSWLKRDIPATDFLVGEVFSTTTRALIVADTGLGKTNFAMGLGIAMARGMNFLHWQCRRPVRVLYIDGEMSVRLVKRRLADAVRRAGGMPDEFCLLSREDVPEMQPLNTEAGRALVEAVIKHIGGVDFIIFDNIMCLLSGDMKEEQPWQDTLPWIRDLTRRGIGQAWIHHTGHDAGRSYGTKTREWQLDTVILLTKAARTDTDVSFSLEFTKARERTPDNRADFAKVTVALVDDAWTVDRPEAPPPSLKVANDNALTGHNAVAMEALKDALARDGRKPPGDQFDNIPASATVVTVEAWRERFYGRVITPDSEAEVKQDTAKKAFQRATKLLQGKRLVGAWGGYCWLVKDEAK